MRKLIKLAVVALGIHAFRRWRKSRKQAHAGTASPAPTADPADELRQKLAESRDDVLPEEADEPPAASVADRRAEVHEQGRAALDEMKPTGED